VKALLFEKDTSGLKPKFDYSLYESGEGLSTIKFRSEYKFLTTSINSFTKSITNTKTWCPSSKSIG
jgi:hypothetical protein